MILSEIGEQGAWTNVYRGEQRPQFDLPTVEGVDYPNLGISEAINDEINGKLYVSTYASTAASKGQRTFWRVTQLPDVKTIEVYCGDEQYHDWRRVNDTEIEIQSSIDSHRFTVHWQTPRNGARLDSQSNAKQVSSTAVSSAPPQVKQYRPAPPPSCACC